MTLSKQAIYDYFVSNFYIDSSEISDETLLFTTGVIDSFKMIEFIVFLEQSCNIKIQPGEITLDNLDSIERVMKFIEGKITLA